MERFDDLTRAMARPHSRRSVLKAVGVAAAGATAATLLKPFRGQAAVCPAGVATCGSGCCQKGESCSDPSTGCCCPAGTTPCGQTCCSKGIACVDSGSGVCGCPAGTTSCGSAGNLTCCNKGKACGDASCQPVSNFSSNVNKVCSPPCSTGTVLFTDDFNSDVEGPYCGVAPAGWSLNPSDGNVDIFNPLDGASSGNVLDLDGSPNICGGDGVPLVSLKNPITIVQGRTYTACFRLGTNPFPGVPGGVDINSATVSFGPTGNQVSNTYTKQPSQKGTYTNESLRFVATANGTAQLTFQELGPSDRGGITVDTVTITEQP
ncbi:MAG: hypothetical protein JO148_15365 [Acidimicrobiia bacterium]|nr:hypothetical protein [Acidimicrobiia bacterium]